MATAETADFSEVELIFLFLWRLPCPRVMLLVSAIEFFFCLSASLDKGFEATIKLETSRRRPVDPVVYKDHAGHGAPEGHDGGEHGVGDVGLEHADGRVGHHARLAGPGVGISLNFTLKATVPFLILMEVRNILLEYTTHHPRRMGMKEMRHGQNQAAQIIPRADLRVLPLKDRHELIHKYLQIRNPNPKLYVKF